MRYVLSFLWCCVTTAVADPLNIQGVWQQGELLFGRVTPGSRVEILGHHPLIMPDGRFVFGLDRDAPASLRVTITSADNRVIQQDYAVAPRQYDIQRVNGVADKYVHPPKAVEERIAADAQLVAAARKRLDARDDISQPFSWPLSGRISGVFGSQRIFNGVPSRPHYGLDIAAPVGTMVRAPQAGIVTLAEKDLYFSGGTIIVDHGQGVNSTFMHLSKVLVKTGQLLKQGDPIAEVGATGRVTGPHLDWRMNWFDQHLDTQRLIADKPQPTLNP